MELVDRYLHNIRFFLPRRERADIIRELADDLQSQVQDREAELGRALNEDELAGILKRCGPPLLVAGRYLPQQQLIGPLLFPVYRFVLKLALWIYLLPWLAVWVGLVAFSTSYRAAHPGLALVGTLTTWLHIAAYLFCGITIGFAVLERIQVRRRVFERWDPRRLPAVRDPRVISRFTSISEIVWGSLFLLWWVGALHFPTFSDDTGQALVLTWTASFQRFYWPVLLLYVATTALAIVNLFWPSWTVARAGWRLAGNVCVTVVACLLAAAGPWVEVQAPGLSEQARAFLLRAVNQSLFWLFIGIAVVSALVACFEDGRRIYRMVFTKYAPGEGDGRAANEPKA